MNIGQAAAASGVSAKSIRHYEANGLIRAPRRTAANYRSYSDNDVHVLRFVKRARALGFSMDDIKTLLSLWQDKSRSSSAVKRIARAHIDELERRITELQSMVRTLEHLARHCHGDHRPECPILEELAK
jgi:MerR family transcriptional regulator, copper efflux regulator